MKRKHNLLLYLAISGASAAFWTAIVRLIYPGLSRWLSVGLFLVLSLFSFGMLACLTIGDHPELPARRDDL